MSGFAAGWLDLREAADARARSQALSERLERWLDRRRRVNAALRITDLGGGTGANLRWLAPRLEGDQRWRIVDNDADLLAAQRRRFAQWARTRTATVSPKQHDGMTAGGDRLVITTRSQTLAIDALPLDLYAQLPALDLAAEDLVTASALLDLVSRAWLESLVAELAGSGGAALFALTYDGMIVLEPESADDRLLGDLVNRHQRGDKGFGPALGPAATDATAACFAGAGFATWRAPSAWRLDASEAELQRALIAGWVEAAVEVDPDAAPRLAGWAGMRHSQIEAGELVIVVGHEDLLALPS